MDRELLGRRDARKGYLGLFRALETVLPPTNSYPALILTRTVTVRDSLAASTQSGRMTPRISPAVPLHNIERLVQMPVEVGFC